MAVKKTTKAKAATKDTKVTKSVKTTKAEPKKSVLKSLEVHILVILAIVAFAFLLFALGMASGAAITMA
jgi:hypothetical protein